MPPQTNPLVQPNGQQVYPGYGGRSGNASGYYQYNPSQTPIFNWNTDPAAIALRAKIASGAPLTPEEQATYNYYASGGRGSNYIPSPGVQEGVGFLDKILPNGVVPGPNGQKMTIGQSLEYIDRMNQERTNAMEDAIGAPRGSMRSDSAASRIANQVMNNGTGGSSQRQATTSSPSVNQGAQAGGSTGGSRSSSDYDAAVLPSYVQRMNAADGNWSPKWDQQIYDAWKRGDISTSQYMQGQNLRQSMGPTNIMGGQSNAPADRESRMQAWSSLNIGPDTRSMLRDADIEYERSSGQSGLRNLDRFELMGLKEPQARGVDMLREELKNPLYKSPYDLKGSELESQPQPGEADDASLTPEQRAQRQAQEQRGQNGNLVSQLIGSGNWTGATQPIGYGHVIAQHRSGQWFLDFDTNSPWDLS